MGYLRPGRIINCKRREKEVGYVLSLQNHFKDILNINIYSWILIVIEYIYMIRLDCLWTEAIFKGLNQE